MSEPRLKAGFWVQAYLMRLQLADIPAYVTAKGDADAGAVLVKLATLDGNAQLWAREPGADWRPVWTCVKTGEERMVDETVEKRRRSDPDLWVVEVEDRRGRTLLEQEGLA